MDETRIKELRALCEAATAGPWRFGHSGPCGRQYFACNVRTTRGPIGQGTIFRVWERGDESQANAKFAAEARTALPKALDAIEARDREIKLLRKALKRIVTSPTNSDAAERGGQAPYGFRRYGEEMQEIARKALRDVPAGAGSSGGPVT